MSLHFDLRVGTTTIGGFEAQRRSPLIDGQSEYLYDVTVSAHGLRVKFVVTHNRDDGAYVLVGNALTEALKLEPGLNVYPFGARRP